MQNTEFDPFLAMQQAVDIVLTSKHPDSKVAACLYKGEHATARTNEWPMAILEALGHEARIGDSSGTVHAEMNCLLHFPVAADGGAISITDPCCPNCAKAITECGLKYVYIDHMGFKKDFAVRRGEEFQEMSLGIMAQAGITIYEVYRKKRQLKIIHKPKNLCGSPEVNPIEVRKLTHCEKEGFKRLISAVKPKHISWGAAIAQDQNGNFFSLVASTHLAIGFEEDILRTPPNLVNQKYSYYMTPLNRLICGAVRYGLTLKKGFVFLSQLPTPREMVNSIGAGVNNIWIAQPDIASKDSSFAARDILSQHRLLNFHPWVDEIEDLSDV